MTVALGISIPPDTPHAISVSLPTWKDNVGYEEGEKRVIDKMMSGYPRFFIHSSIRKLSEFCEQKYTLVNERCMLFPTQNIAEQCRSFMLQRSSLAGSPVNARIVHLFICPEDKQSDGTAANKGNTSLNCVDLHIVLFPSDSFALAKEFWQHTGLGISSRLAERCLSILVAENPQIQPASPILSRFPTKCHNKHYSVKSACKSKTRSLAQPSSQATDNLDSDHGSYLEERYGRNLPLDAGASAKRALRRRVAGVLVHDKPYDCNDEPCAGQRDAAVGPSSRGISNVSENDVYLYPSGMSAIWSAHQLALALRPSGKSVCFSFPYADTLKVLEKWGPGCYFFGHGVDSEIDDLERLLDISNSSTEAPIFSLFTEFPSNPLLRSADLPRLRALADKHDFLIVIDETVGNFVNVEVLPYADIVVSSLTKVFSGASNVMGGSLVLNPRGRHYESLKTRLGANYEEGSYFDEDAIFMERNSRDFKRRIKVIDANAQVICELLRSHSIEGGASRAVIKKVFYPKYTTREHYDRCRIKNIDSGEEEGGYGGLFSLTFTSDKASKAFFDTLPCCKGPSLGTNFTLASPFTILAHFGELEWASTYGVEEGLVRVSVGMEETEELLNAFKMALDAAEATAEGH